MYRYQVDLLSKVRSDSAETPLCYNNIIAASASLYLIAVLHKKFLCTLMKIIYDYSNQWTKTICFIANRFFLEWFIFKIGGGAKSVMANISISTNHCYYLTNLNMTDVIHKIGFFPLNFTKWLQWCSSRILPQTFLDFGTFQSYVSDTSSKSNFFIFKLYIP